MVSDDRFGDDRQYFDGFTVGRFEECLAAEVLDDTIPRKALPDTGGTPLLVPILGGALLGAGLLVGRSSSAVAESPWWAPGPH